MSEEKQLIILKIDLKSIDDLKTYVYYEIYNPDTFQIINIEEICDKDFIEINSPVILDNNTLILSPHLASLGYNLFNGNDTFYNDICTPYTHLNGADMLLIDRKIYIYNISGNQDLCQKDCEIVFYNDFTKKVKCDCNIQKNNIDIDFIKNVKNLKFYKKEISESFFNVISNSNFQVLKCYKLAFYLKKFFNNIGRIIMTILIIILIVLDIFYLIKGNKELNYYFGFILKNKLEFKNRKKKDKEKIKSKHHHHHKKKDSKKNIEKCNQEKIKNKKEKNKIKEKKKDKKIDNKNETENIKKSPNKNSNNDNNNKNPSSPPKNQSYSISQNIPIKSTKVSHKNKMVNNLETGIDNKSSFVILNEKMRYSIIRHKPILLNEEELNNLNYKMARKIDQRTYWEYYWSLIKTKHLILFTFINNRDYNLKIIKLYLLLFSFSLYLNLNGFFFTDNTMHIIYKNDGAYKFINQIPKMVYSTIISISINLMLKKLSLTGKNILELKKEKNYEIASKNSIKTLKCIKIKLRIFFSLSFLFLIFFWYFLSCFCGVYINTQIILLKDTLISFSLSLVYPFGLNLIPGLFRIPALRAKKKDKECMYKASVLIALI